MKYYVYIPCCFYQLHGVYYVYVRSSLVPRPLFLFQYGGEKAAWGQGYVHIAFTSCVESIGFMYVLLHVTVSLLSVLALSMRRVSQFSLRIATCTKDSMLHMYLVTVLTF